MIPSARLGDCWLMMDDSHDSLSTQLSCIRIETLLLWVGGHKVRQELCQTLIQGRSEVCFGVDSDACGAGAGVRQRDSDAPSYEGK